MGQQEKHRIKREDHVTWDIDNRCVNCNGSHLVASPCEAPGPSRSGGLFHGSLFPTSNKKDV